MLEIFRFRIYIKAYCIGDSKSKGSALSWARQRCSRQEGWRERERKRDAVNEVGRRVETERAEEVWW